MNNREREIDERLRQAAQENADKIEESAAFVCLFSEKMVEDVIPLIQMGLAIYMDKPIALLVPEGATIPENLRKVAQDIEYFKRDPADMSSLKRAMERLMLRFSVLKDGEDLGAK